MNNLYRELAPITDEAWAEIENEAARTFKRHIAGRRVVDVSEPGGPSSAAVSTGHLLDVAAPADGVQAHLRESKPLVRLRVPFTISRPRPSWGVGMPTSTRSCCIWATGRRRRRFCAAARWKPRWA